MFNTPCIKYFTHNSTLEMEMFGSKPSVVLIQSLPRSIKQDISSFQKLIQEVEKTVMISIYSFYTVKDL